MTSREALQKLIRAWLEQMQTIAGEGQQPKDHPLAKRLIHTPPED